MRDVSIKILLTLLVLLLLILPQHTVCADNHKYHTGIVSYRTYNQVCAAGRTFALSPTVKVIIRYKERGAYYERKGNLSDVNVGNTVYLKATGNSVSEIVVMR
jgi:hypothetical protein